MERGRLMEVALGFMDDLGPDLEGVVGEVGLGKHRGGNS